MGNSINKVEKIYNLTPLQEGMLFHAVSDEFTDEYLLQDTIKVTGKADTEKIKQCVQLIVQKYDILRTVILYKKFKKPRQVVLKEKEIDVAVYEVKDGESIQDKIEEVKRNDKTRFDLEKGSLFLASIIKSADECYIQFGLHHIIIDGWSFPIIFDDFKSFYARLLKNESYASISAQIASERKRKPEFDSYVKWLEAQDYNGGIEHWKQQLAGYSEQSEIRGYYAERGHGKSFTGKDVVIPADVFNGLSRLAEKMQITMNDIAETVWGLVLQHYNSTRDSVFGKVVSGRNADIPEIDRIAGLFINTIPIRVTLEGDSTTFRELAVSVHKQNVENLSYHFCSLADVQRVSEVGSHLISNLFVFENYETSESENDNPDFNMVVCNVDEETNYDLTVYAFASDTLSFHIKYNEERYGQQDIDNIAYKIQRICSFIAFEPDKVIKDLDLLTDEEKDLVINRFNDTYFPIDTSLTILDLLDASVKTHLDKVAINLLDETITYQELDKLSNRIARHLINIGIEVDDLVAIVATRSIMTIVGILGILKAGAGYVPLDPTYPRERLMYMIEDSRSKALLHGEGELPVDYDGTLVDITDIPVTDDSPVHTSVGPDNLSYIVYTSGTTGKPKGVMLTHKNVVNMHFHCREQYQLTDQDVILQFANLSFDVSVWETFTALLNGGRLCLLTKEIMEDTKLFKQYVEKNGITFVAFPPQYYMQTEDIKIKRIMTCGSDTNPDIIRKAQRNGEQYINGYGPTENTVFTTTWHPDTYDESTIIAVGKPLRNMQVYVLNGMAPCGVGVVGELCCGGYGLARGYLYRPELTAEKFIKNPYGEGRIYRSGDLVRWLPDGNIEFLSRMDDQVKIRGFRVELGEIDSVLRAIDGITNCAVIVHKDENGEKSVHAYIVSPEKVDLEELRKKMRIKLPDYMIPAGIMQIDSMPVTPNGKLNKRALPKIDMQEMNEYIAPRDELEQKVADAFCTVLNAERVGIHDDFFVIGGHSLRAVRLVNLLEETTGIRLKVKELFACRTVENISKVLKEKSGTGYESIPKAEAKACYLASPAQKQMFLVELSAGSGINYNLPAAFETSHPLDTERLRNVMKELVARHEALRTSFFMEGEEIYQQIQKIDFEPEFMEDSVHTNEELISEFVKPFDLGKAPLVRVKIVDRGGSQLLLIDMHHIISDGGTISMLTDEAVRLYKGESLPAVERQYKDYSEWIAVQGMEKQKEYWLGRFVDEVPVLDLPTDYQRESIQNSSGKYVTKLMSAEIKEKVTQLAKQLGTTEYVILLSAFMIVLGKYSAQDDIIVGSPFAGRFHNDLEKIAGMFVNTLPMRGKPLPEKTVRAFISEMQTAFLEAEENQAYPLEEMVRALNIPREISRNPLFDVMLVLQNNENFDDKLKAAGIIELEYGNNVSKFDITFNITGTESGYVLGTEYKDTLFKEYFIDHLVSTFANALERMPESIDTQIKDYDILTDEDREQVLYTFNDTYYEYDDSKTIIDLFEEQVKLHPERTAVNLRDDSMMYLALDKLSNRIARELLASGVVKGDLIAIIASRSPLTIAGIIGIIKSGAAYVPIDPTYPRDRIEYMLEDSGAKALLRGADELPVEYGGRVLDLSRIEETDDSPVDVEIQPSDLAYVIYTSGTTGKPKGVMLEHKGVVNMHHHFLNAYSVSCEDVVLQFANLLFDVSVWETFTALLNGARLCLLSKEIIEDTKLFKQYVAENGITLVTFPPQYYVQSEDVRIDKILTAGSETNAEVIRKALRNGRYINAYGPTESTVYASSWEPTEYNDSTVISIGKPLNNLQLYVLNGTSLCGVGMLGELCIGGAGLARGYHNRPELTAEKFIDNPFGEGKIYRAGDLARWLPDGNIEYLGRLDDQVKIRGFRVELGEIASVIRDVEGITDVAVIVRSDDNGEKAVYAYVVSPETVDIEALRNAMRIKLPDYMIPAGIMQIEKLPLTPNGKLNKRELPMIDMQGSNEYEAPRTDLERKVAEAFKTVLNAERVGIRDDFFGIGGHSLRAVRLVNMIEEISGVRLKVKDIFEYKTVEKICQALESTDHGDFESIPKAEKKDAYVVSPAQKRIFIDHLRDETGMTYNMPAALRITRKLDADQLGEAFTQLVKRHEALRTSFFMDGSNIYQRVENIDFELDRIASDGRTDEELIRDFVKPFDIAHAPLFRARLADCGDYQLLMVDMHHIISDGATIGILAEELIRLYKGETLPALPVQYTDYSEWIASKDLEKQKEYWLDKFRGEIPVLDLPTDYPRGLTKSFSGSVLFRQSEKGLAVRVKEAASELGTTEYSLLMAAFMILLSRYADEGDDVIVGTSFAGRNHRELEGMAGMFVNTIALRGTPSEDKSAAEFVREIGDEFLAAVENQDYPFEDLVDSLNIRKDASRNPLFDVMFVLQNNETSFEDRLRDAGIEAVDLAQHVARFDISLTVQAKDGSYEFITEYCDKLFKEPFVSGLISSFEKTLCEMLEDMNVTIEDIDTMSEEEQRMIMLQFNDIEE